MNVVHTLNALFADATSDQIDEASHHLKSPLGRGALVAEQFGRGLSRSDPSSPYMSHIQELSELAYQAVSSVNEILSVLSRDSPSHVRNVMCRAQTNVALEKLDAVESKIGQLNAMFDEASDSGSQEYLLQSQIAEGIVQPVGFALADLAEILDPHEDSSLLAQIERRFAYDRMDASNPYTVHHTVKIDPLLQHIDPNIKSVYGIIGPIVNNALAHAFRISNDAHGKLKRMQENNIAQHVTINCRYDTEKDLVKYSIHDNGIGIENKDAVFQKGYSTNNHGDAVVGSSGNGMSAVQGRTHALGGSIELHSGVHFGTSILVGLSGEVAYGARHSDIRTGISITKKSPSNRLATPLGSFVGEKSPFLHVN